jgi:hypothetical protein
MRRLTDKLTYANVVATIALFIAVGGASAFAATQLGKNSVGSRQIKKNAVSAAKIKNGAVTGNKIASNAVTASKIADESVTTGKIANNAVTAGKLANESVTTGKLANGSVNSAKVLDNSLTGKDVAPDSLTGANILESSLGQVPDAAKLGGKTASAFTSSSIYKNESAVEAGTLFETETHYIDEACNPGDVLITGGPANVSITSTMLESFPTPGLTNSWRARLKTPAADKFNVVVLCAKQG